MGSYIAARTSFEKDESEGSLKLPTTVVAQCLIEYMRNSWPVKPPLSTAPTHVLFHFRPVINERHLEKKTKPNSKQEENDFQQRKQQQQQQQAATRKSQSADDANRGTADTPTIIIDNNKVVVTPLLSGLSEDASTPRKAKHHVRGQSQPLPIFDEITTATATRTSVARGGNGIQQSISITNSETVSSSTERSSAMLSARDLQASHAERVLVVGKGVALTADVTSCDTVVVEGQFKGNIKTGIFVLAEGELALRRICPTRSCLCLTVFSQATVLHHLNPSFFVGMYVLQKSFCLRRTTYYMTAF